MQPHEVNQLFRENQRFNAAFAEIHNALDATGVPPHDSPLHRIQQLTRMLTNSVDSQARMIAQARRTEEKLIIHEGQDAELGAAREVIGQARAIYDAGEYDQGGELWKALVRYDAALTERQRKIQQHQEEAKADQEGGQE